MHAHVPNARPRTYSTRGWVHLSLMNIIIEIREINQSNRRLNLSTKQMLAGPEGKFSGRVRLLPQFFSLATPLFSPFNTIAAASRIE